MSAHARGRRQLGLLTAAAALGTLVLYPLSTGPALAASPAVASQTVGAVTSDVVPPLGTPAPARPSVLTSVGRSVSVLVAFFDAYGNPASFNQNTDVVLTTSGVGGTTVVRTVGKGVQSVDLSTANFATAANKVTVTVSVPGVRGKAIIPPVTSPTVFDVLQFLTPPVTAGSNYVQNVGRTGLGCPTVTAADPLCATVYLPLGAAGNVVLGTGACDGPNETYTNCDRTSSFVLELLGDLSPYGQTSPVTVVLTCDKEYCGRGPIQGNVPVFTQGGNAQLEPVTPCPAKGVAKAVGACVDYVQSTRDNAGDTHLYVLFTRDARMSCC